MERRIFHGILSPTDIAQALLAEFSRGNLRAQVLGKSDKLAVQIGTRPGSMSGGGPPARRLTAAGMPEAHRDGQAVSGPWGAFECSL